MKISDDMPLDGLLPGDGDLENPEEISRKALPRGEDARQDQEALVQEFASWLEAPGHDEEVQPRSPEGDRSDGGIESVEDAETIGRDRENQDTEPNRRSEPGIFDPLRTFIESLLPGTVEKTPEDAVPASFPLEGSSRRIPDDAGFHGPPRVISLDRRQTTESDGMSDIPVGLHGLEAPAGGESPKPFAPGNGGTDKAAGPSMPQGYRSFQGGVEILGFKPYPDSHSDETAVEPLPDDGAVSPPGNDRVDHPADILPETGQRTEDTVKISSEPPPFHRIEEEDRPAQQASTPLSWITGFPLSSPTNTVEASLPAEGDPLDEVIAALGRATAYPEPAVDLPAEAPHGMPDALTPQGEACPSPTKPSGADCVVARSPDRATGPTEGLPGMAATATDAANLTWRSAVQQVARSGDRVTTTVPQQEILTPATPAQVMDNGQGEAGERPHVPDRTSMGMAVPHPWEDHTGTGNATEPEGAKIGLHPESVGNESWMGMGMESESDISRLPPEEGRVEADQFFHLPFLRDTDSEGPLTEWTRPEPVVELSQASREPANEVSSPPQLEGDGKLGQDGGLPGGLQQPLTFGTEHTADIPNPSPFIIQHSSFSPDSLPGEEGEELRMDLPGASGGPVAREEDKVLPREVAVDLSVEPVSPEESVVGLIAVPNAGEVVSEDIDAEVAIGIPPGFPDPGLTGGNLELPASPEMPAPRGPSLATPPDRGREISPAFDLPSLHEGIEAPQEAPHLPGESVAVQESGREPGEPVKESAMPEPFVGLGNTAPREPASEVSSFQVLEGDGRLRQDQDISEVFVDHSISGAEFTAAIADLSSFILPDSSFSPDDSPHPDPLPEGEGEKLRMDLPGASAGPEAREDGSVPIGVMKEVESSVPIGVISIAPAESAFQEEALELPRSPYVGELASEAILDEKPQSQPVLLDPDFHRDGVELSPLPATRIPDVSSVDPVSERGVEIFPTFDLGSFHGVLDTSQEAPHMPQGPLPAQESSMEPKEPLVGLAMTEPARELGDMAPREPASEASPSRPLEGDGRLRQNGALPGEPPQLSALGTDHPAATTGDPPFIVPGSSLSPDRSSFLVPPSQEADNEPAMREVTEEVEAMRFSARLSEDSSPVSGLTERPVPEPMPGEIREIVSRILVSDPRHSSQEEVRIVLEDSFLQGTEIRIVKEGEGIKITIVTDSNESFDFLAHQREPMGSDLQEKLGRDIEVKVEHTGQRQQDQNEGRSRQRRNILDEWEP